MTGPQPKPKMLQTFDCFQRRLGAATDEELVGISGEKKLYELILRTYSSGVFALMNLGA